MDITNYTSYDEVRATCGLSTKELPDTELQMEIYENVLSIALADISLPTATPGPGPLSTRFIEIVATAVRTTAEQKLYDLTRIFSTYTVALEAVVSLSMKAPKAISDSKATLTRFSPESVYKDVIERIEKGLKDVISKIENISETTVAPLPFMGIAVPDTDIVTGDSQ